MIPMQSSSVPRSHISSRTESLLGWYFSTGRSAEEQSPFAAMVERLLMFARYMTPCKRCGGHRDAHGVPVYGTGFNDQDGTCGTCHGCGYVETRTTPIVGSKADAVFANERCIRCRGYGQREGEPDKCERCRGKGYVPLYTALPKGSQHTSPPKDPDLDVWAELGRIGSALDRVRAIDPGAVQTLEMYYGPFGNRWGAHKFGRIFSLYPLTKPGRKLAEMGRKKSESAHTHDMGAHDLLAAEKGKLDGLSGKFDQHRKSLLVQAHAASLNLYERAKVAWCEVE